MTEVVHRHRDERAGDALSGGEQHVQLSRVRLRRDPARELEQRVGRVPIAETVPTTRTPASCASTSRRATCRILSGSATDEPPNFMTTVSGAGSGLTLIGPIVAVPAVACWTGGYAPRVPRKVMLIGLDCAEPSLVLERWRDRAADDRRA